jgi:mono/diheme cytochrome c family protein
MGEKRLIKISSFSAFVLGLLLAGASELRPAAGDLTKGKQTFDSACSACHTIGGGVRVGPDLKEITNQRSSAWLAAFIANPDQVIKSGDPVAGSLLKKFNGLEMPNLGLSGDKVGDILAYLRSTASPPEGQAHQPPASTVVSTAPQQAAEPTPPLQPSQTPAAAAVAPTGSAAIGERLFLGSVSFQKGGPPCFSCHDVSSLPFPGGGTLGPDLTGAFAKFGATGMNSVLGTLPFPTMRPIFAGRPLTPREQQDLEAFLQKAGMGALIGRTGPMVLSVLGGLLLLVIATWILWKNRLVSIRRALVQKALKAGGKRK